MSDTSSKAVVETNEWDSSLGSIVGDMNGQPLNVHKLMANHPKLLAEWWSLRQHVVSGGALGIRNAELVILRTAVNMRCWYEWASHVERGLKNGLSMEEIERVVDGPEHPDWSENDSLIIRAVDELENEHKIAPATCERLENTNGRQAVLDLIATRATYVMLGNMLNTWDTRLDQHVANALPAGFTRDDFYSKLDAIL
jgi:4-carboxymuconolactone decarboxylase